MSHKPLGRFIYDKLMEEDGRFIACEVTVFPLVVKRQLKNWPEMEQREIRWVSAKDAAALADEEGLKPILEAFSIKMEAKRKAVPEQLAEEPAASV